MDVNYLVAKCIVSHLPRERRYIDVKTAPFYDSNILAYSTDILGDILVSVERIPLDIIKILRLLHSAFTELFDIFDLCRKRHVDLFREQYSAIMLGNHEFDMRWAVFPASRDGTIYDEWMSHQCSHPMSPWKRRPTVCRYCDVEYQNYLDESRATPKPQIVYRSISSAYDDRDSYFQLSYPPSDVFQNISKYDIVMDLKLASRLISWNGPIERDIQTTYYNPTPQATSRAVRMSSHVPHYIETPEGERVGMTKSLAVGIAYESIVQNTVQNTVQRRATAADLGFPTRRQAKRDKRKR